MIRARRCVMVVRNVPMPASRKAGASTCCTTFEMSVMWSSIIGGILARSAVVPDGLGFRGSGEVPVADHDEVAMRMLHVPHGDNGEPVILTFAEGRVSGHAGCNRMMAAYELGPEAGKIGIKAPVTTRMACEEGRMRFEAAFTKAFGAATALRFEGPHMYLESPGVPPLKFHLRELQGG
ncbi:MAG: META domain-containing protein [Gammaproteobacteria bacterium]|nr:META domain-containing protein [Gammaproteobacteria bacterium]